MYLLIVSHGFVEVLGDDEDELDGRAVPPLATNEIQIW